MVRLQKISIVIVFFHSFFIHGQIQFFEKDTNPNKKRIVGSSIGVGSFWTGSIAGLANVWYSESWGDEFRFFNDGEEWLQMDKVGHAWSGYHLQRNVTELYRWSGLSPKNSLLIGGAASLGYLASFEVLDGFSDGWGFSAWDIAGNAAGVVLYSAQDLLWKEQRISFKFFGLPSNYAQYRPETLGHGFAEQLLKDYNGQTYWLNFTPSYFFESALPKWLSFSFGYSIQEKLNGFDNQFSITSNGEELTFNAYRELMFSFDIDFQRIKTNKAWLKTLFSALNHVKVPIPALALSKNGWRVGY
jgi:uncharacterized protein YfiM (DUF2279 family)